MAAALVAGCGSPPPSAEAVTLASQALDDCGDATHPVRLACTGLYRDPAAQIIADGVVRYDPGFALWSDAAEKNRYVLIPAGTQIDTSNADEWTFPVGTKLWKEFVITVPDASGAPLSRKAETRLFWKRGTNDWFRTTYVWNAEQTDAVEVTTGVINVFGTGYEIPKQAQCDACHKGRKDKILGFEAISLAAPNATIGDPADGVGALEGLNARGALSTSPTACEFTVPGHPAASAALGWLHGNCGTACHNPNGLAASTGLFMRLTSDKLSSLHQTDTYVTAVNQPTTSFQPGQLSRVKLGDASQSAVYIRASSRTPGIQMPPIDSHKVDVDGVALLKAWIEEDLRHHRH